MKLSSRKTARSRRASLQMTSMIDVVFLLLVFFVWTASFEIVEYVLPGRLSAATGTGSDAPAEPPPERDFDPVVIHLLWDGGHIGWLLNDTPLASLAAIRTTLESVARIKSDVPVIIDPQQEVPLGHVIDVYDVARLSGFEKVQFAATDS